MRTVVLALVLGLGIAVAGCKSDTAPPKPAGTMNDAAKTGADAAKTGADAAKTATDAAKETMPKKE